MPSVLAKAVLPGRTQLEPKDKLDACTQQRVTKAVRNQALAALPSST